MRAMYTVTWCFPYEDGNEEESRTFEAATIYHAMGDIQEEFPACEIFDVAKH